MKSNNSKSFNYGSLIGRIGNINNNKVDEKEKEKDKDKKKRVFSLINQNNFLVFNELTFQIKEEGPLYLRPNWPKKNGN